MCHAGVGVGVGVCPVDHAHLSLQRDLPVRPSSPETTCRSVYLPCSVVWCGACTELRTVPTQQCSWLKEGYLVFHDSSLWLQ